MAEPINRRTSTALERVRQAIVAHYGQYQGSINADLAASGSPYQLPNLGASDVLIRAQGATLPTATQVRVVPQTVGQQRMGAGNGELAEASLTLDVWCAVFTDGLTPDPALDREGLLLRAGYDMAEAVQAAIYHNALGAVGVYDLSSTLGRHELLSIHDEPDGEGGVEVNGILVQLTLLLTQRRGW